MDPGQFDKQGFSSMWFQYELQRSIMEMYVTIQIFYPVFASLNTATNNRCFDGKEQRLTKKLLIEELLVMKS